MPSNSLAIADSGARPSWRLRVCAAARPLSWRSGRHALGGAATLPDEEHPVKRRVVIQKWRLDRDNYIAVPVMSDGREGPPLELRELFEQFHTEAR